MLNADSDLLLAGWTWKKKNSWPSNYLDVKDRVFMCTHDSNPKLTHNIRRICLDWKHISVLLRFSRRRESFSAVEHV